MRAHWRFITVAGAALMATGLLAARPLGSPGLAAQAQGAGPAGDLIVVPVQRQVYMLVGAGPNIVVQVGERGALVVDPGPVATGAKALAAVRGINKSGRPLQYIIDTAFDLDHTGANGLFAKSGWREVDPNEPVPILSHEKVMRRMTAPTGQKDPRESPEDWPTDTYFDELKELSFNGESIQIFYAPAAHTDGDSIVYFRGSDVIAAGDIFVTTTYPVIDVEHGGTVNGVIDALNHILELAVPAEKQEDGTLIVPGHGRLCDEADVASYRDMVTIVRDRIANAVQKGMTLEQVKASTLTLEYDARYGRTPGPGSRDQFIEAVYKTVPRTRPSSNQ
jgi:glyoxylase-like metal-dependent hydrolase (beta-lactamase superfamily II)